jgi:hypothetical protein
MISNRERLTNAHLRTPRAAAVAGIAFSVLLFVVFGLIRLSVPADPLEPGAWLDGDITYVSLAMNLVPFAGVAFLWFVGALRDKLGQREDQFFATVFLGSGILFSGDAVCWRCGRRRDCSRVSCSSPGAGPFRHFSFWPRLGVCDLQHLPDEDRCRVHDHNVNHRYLHPTDASLAGNQRLRHRRPPPHWEFLCRRKSALVSVLGFVGQSLHAA